MISRNSRSFLIALVPVVLLLALLLLIFLPLDSLLQVLQPVLHGRKRDGRVGHATHLQQISWKFSFRFSPPIILCFLFIGRCAKHYLFQTAFKIKLNARSRHKSSYHPVIRPLHILTIFKLWINWRPRPIPRQRLVMQMCDWHSQDAWAWGSG